MSKLNILNPTVSLSDSPTVVLIRPQLGENIGAVARAMLNFGWTELRIVSPRDGWPNQNAVAVAAGAGRVLDNAKIFGTTEQACSDLQFVYATTVRNRDLTKEVHTPEEAMMASNNLLRHGQKVGILFGPERAGLENRDLCLAGRIISVPVNTDFSSLNLSQCVVLIAYEWFKQTKAKALQPANKIDWASLKEVEHLRFALQNNLESVNYFWPDDRKLSLLENLNNLVGRLPLTSSDVRTLHGIIRALKKKQS